MSTLHVIDAARIVHETRRTFFEGATAPEITATWGDLPEDQRQKKIADVRKILDHDPSVEPFGQAEHLRVAIVNALRPFLEE